MIKTFLQYCRREAPILGRTAHAHFLNSLLFVRPREQTDTWHYTTSNFYSCLFIYLFFVLTLWTQAGGTKFAVPCDQYEDQQQNLY